MQTHDIFLLFVLVNGEIMDKVDILGNIGIARRYLGDYCLLVSDDKVVFDCYCLPSFRWKAFYAQVYVQNGIFRANCAYTRYADFWGLESYSVSFTSIEEKRLFPLK